jgi:hypothetical protein
VFQDPLPPGLPPERSEGHSFLTKPGHPPPFRSMYRLSPLEYRELEKQVTKFLKDGILEVSQSPYGAPVLFVTKPNGRALRLCVDYRALNSITVENRCTIPRIDNLLDAVAGNSYFTSLDLTPGYHQILIFEEDRPKTALRTPFGHFQFKVLIEGLTNAPATFQTVMNSILHPYIRKFVVVYIDNILIFSKSEDEHQAHVRLVLKVLNVRSSTFEKQSLASLRKRLSTWATLWISRGFVLTPRKLRPSRRGQFLKMYMMYVLFLGLVNYFRKFIEHHSEIAVPLTNLTKKSHPWVWTGRCQDAFELLKQKLIEAPMLRTPNESLPYEVVTDASDLRLGGVLLQGGHPVAFESKKLNDAELNYQTTEKEMLAVVHALRVWRCYLEGVKFTVYTDHVSNTYFQTQPNLTRRQARWSEFLQRFGAFEWKYRKGSKNVADALSRRDVAGSVWRFCRAAQFQVVGTAGAVAAGHIEAFQRIRIPGQGEDVAGDQGSAKVLTFDLSIPLLKRLISGSRSLY